MTLSLFCAALYTVLAAVIGVFLGALALGVPWGHLTMGGRWPGVLPRWVRPLSVLQALILLGMAASLLDRADGLSLDWPSWSAPVTLAVTGLTLVANAMSPSRAERALWVPVIIVMMMCALVVVFA